MKKRLLLVALTLLILLGTAAALADETVTFDLTYEYDMARAVLSGTNALRTGKDAWYWNSDNKTKTDLTGSLQPLQYDYGLEKAAMERAAEIAVYFAHQRPDGSSCFSVHAYACGENIAAGYGSADSVVIAWREDEEDYAGQGHRRNMLMPDFTTMGVGCVLADGVLYWVQEFGRAPTGESASSLTGPKTMTVNPDVIGSVGSITLSKDSLSVNAGSKAALPTVTVRLGWAQMPATVNSAVWTSGKTGVAQISGKKVEGIAAGTATLKAAAFGQTASIKVTVKGEASKIPVDAANFPDAAFRQYVADNVDANGDGALTAAEIAKVTAMDLSGVKTIENLTGIALFTSLKTLNVSNNRLAAVDLSKNTKLKSFVADGNVRPVNAPLGVYDLKKLSGFKIAKASGFSGGDLDGTVLTVLKPGKITYTYDCGRGFSAVFTLNMKASPRYAVTGAVTTKKTYTYTGAAIKPGVTVTALVKGESVTLKKGQYKITYENNVSAGKGTLTVTGTGFFKGEVKVDFTIAKVKLKTLTLKYTAKAYTGKALKPAVTVTAKVGSKEVTLTKGVDFTVTYTDNISAGTATVKVKGKGNFKGTLTETFTIKKIKLASAQLKSAKVKYTGKALKPAVTVTAKVGGQTITLKKGEDYTVTYKDNVEPGTATAVIKGKGNYSGTITLTFTIKK